MKTKKLTEEEFLAESNFIEGEYSQSAMKDAVKVWQYAKTIKRITIQEILKIHKILMKSLEPSIAGKIREVPVYIGGERKYQTKKEIEEELRLLCNLGIYPVFSEEEIRRWHIQFEKIHPFADGNGRTGRILMNLQRIKAGLPVLVIKEKEKYDYYKWFKGEKK